MSPSCEVLLFVGMQVRQYYTEAKLQYRRRSSVPLLVEVHMQPFVTTECTSS